MDTKWGRRCDYSIVEWSEKTEGGVTIPDDWINVSPSGSLDTHLCQVSCPESESVFISRSLHIKSDSTWCLEIHGHPVLTNLSIISEFLHSRHWLYLLNLTHWKLVPGIPNRSLYLLLITSKMASSCQLAMKLLLIWIPIVQWQCMAIDTRALSAQQTATFWQTICVVQYAWSTERTW